MKCHNPTEDSVTQLHCKAVAAEWNKKWGAEFHFSRSLPTPPPPPPQIRNKRRPLFFKTPTTFWSVWMELTDNWHLYPPSPPETHFGPLACNLRWCWQQKLQTDISVPHIGYPSIGEWGGGGGSANKKMNRTNRLCMLLLVLNRWVNIYLNFPKCPFFCSLCLRTSWRLQHSQLCQPMSCDSEQACFFIVFLRYVWCFVASQRGKTSLQCTPL